MSRQRLAFMLGVTVSIAAACQRTPQAPVQSPVERGKHLVTVSACNDCHTPWKPGPNGPEQDLARLLSGHPADLAMPPAPTLPPGPWMITAAATLTAWSGPWGVSFSANLTPDEETGIGAWDENMFIQAIRTGKHLGGGRDILPPMPWHMYRAYSDEDLKAIFAYLKSVPPLKNQVPDPIEPATAPRS